MPNKTCYLSNTTFSAVLRRYSDFLWLYERLHMERAGAIIPPIPEKQPVGRFSPAFVEDRRFHLERFLRRVAIHPELHDCKCLDTFLRADDVTFSAQKANKGEVVASISSAMYTRSSSETSRWLETMVCRSQNVHCRRLGQESRR